MPVKIKSTLGSVTLEAENIAADTVLTVPSGTATLATTAEAFNPDAAQVFNESGADVDFRVESDTKTHALFVEGANGRVGIGAVPGAAEVSLVLSADTTASPADQPGIRMIDTNSGNHHQIYVNAGSLYFRDITAGTTRFQLTSDGRGLSQFTAKAWLNVNQTGTQAIRDSHNVSSISDNGTGQTILNFANNMADVNYAAVASAGGAATHHPLTKWNLTPAVGSFVTGVYNTQGNDYVDSSQLSIIVFGD